MMVAPLPTALRKHFSSSPLRTSRCSATLSKEVATIATLDNESGSVLEATLLRKSFRPSLQFFLKSVSTSQALIRHISPSISLSWYLQKISQVTGFFELPWPFEVVRDVPKSLNICQFGSIIQDQSRRVHKNDFLLLTSYCHGEGFGGFRSACFGFKPSLNGKIGSTGEVDKLSDR